MGREIRIRDLKVESEEGSVITFRQGTYDKATGMVKYTTKEFPFIVNKLQNLHKAETKDPLFFMNIFFGVSLLFFVVSSFYMFLPGTSVFKKGIYFALAGVAMTLILIFI